MNPRYKFQELPVESTPIEYMGFSHDIAESSEYLRKVLAEHKQLNPLRLGLTPLWEVKEISNEPGPNSSISFHHLKLTHPDDLIAHITISHFHPGKVFRYILTNFISPNVPDISRLNVSLPELYASSQDFI
jgi:hypothetical protein